MANITHRGERHRTTYTQRQSWQQFKGSEARQTQKARILELLRSGKYSSRQLAENLHIERTSCTRTLRDLQDSNEIQVIDIRKCSTTGKLVQVYTVNTTATQGVLFQ